MRISNQFYTPASLKTHIFSKRQKFHPFVFISFSFLIFLRFLRLVSNLLLFFLYKDYQYTKDFVMKIEAGNSKSFAAL